MQVIGCGRRNGKTTAMIRWWLENPGNRFVLCPNIRMRDNCLHVLRGLAPELLPEIEQLARRQFVTDVYRLRGADCEIGIDDHDLLDRRNREELSFGFEKLVKVITVNE